MILKRALWLVAAAAALAAAAAVFVVALAFAIYALLEPYLGRAGAAGALTLGVALFIGLAGLIAAARVRGPRRLRRRDASSLNLMERLMDLVRDKPFAAAGIAAAVGLLAVRNPRLIGAALRAFLDGWEGPKKR